MSTTRAVRIAAGREHDDMQTPVTEPQRLANEDDDEDDFDGEEEESDAPPAPDEEPDGQPDPAFE